MRRGKYFMNFFFNIKNEYMARCAVRLLLHAWQMNFFTLILYKKRFLVSQSFDLYSTISENYVLCSKLMGIMLHFSSSESIKHKQPLAYHPVTILYGTTTENVISYKFCLSHDDYPCNLRYDLQCNKKLLYICCC